MSPDAAAATATGGGGDGGGGETSNASPSPSPAATTVRWDQILPRRALRVLLVEHDDCTRQVVTALLRKCGYRVAAVADGMKAWDVMRERAYAFDLVLTEVAMPTISGIQLLARIVAAEDCKNIPVIMMSSQDSIGTVLKCMQNGAVDFLVKPVRKNELCNLWQHVWRRHAMNSQTNASENNAASNHISANAGNGSKTGENSDEESDAQSFGSKREPEIQSVEKLPDSLTDERAGSSRKSKIHSESQDGVKTKPHAPKGSDDAPGGSACKTSKVQVFSAERNARSKCLNGITSAKLAEQIMDNALRIADASSHRANNLGKDMATTQPTADRKCKSTVMETNDVVQNTLEESLKRAEIAHAESCPSEFKVVNGNTNQGPREKDIFSHSNSSAFLRYGNQRIEPSAQQQFFPSLCITRQGHAYEKDPLVQPSEILPPRVCNTDERAMHALNPLDGSTDGAAIMCLSSAREDAGASSCSYRKDGMSHPSYGFIPLPIPVGATMPYHYSAILQPLYYAHAPLMHSDSAGINKAAFQHTSSQLNCHENTSKTSQSHEQKQFQDQQLHHSRQIVRESGESVDLARAHAGHINQSASCSQDIHKGSGCTGIAENDIRNIHKGSGCTGIAENGINTNTVVALESGNESGVQNCGYNGFGSNRSRREAALIKFRMKRKDRCFEKKVRYHSRKKLADQRPRVKGQFVSQNLKSSTTIDVESD